MVTKLLVSLLMVAALTAAPLHYKGHNEYECASSCQGNERSYFKYTPSETYVYKYIAVAETEMAGASEQTARMKITTLANIEVLNACEFALRLQDVSVYHSDPFSTSLKQAERSQEFQKALTENTLRFAFDDGIIRNICSTFEEKPWVLNFKRGLLSAFQVSMKDQNQQDQNITETDVSGDCKVRFIKKSPWYLYNSGNLYFQKTKDLLACAKHSSLRSVIPMVPYHARSEVQSLPIVRSSQTCDIKLKDSKILESTMCSESHVFAPFSNQQSGGSTSIEQTLTLKSIKSSVETPQDRIYSRSSLRYQHSNGIEVVRSSKHAAEQKLKEICEQTEYDVRPETPRSFMEFTQIVQGLDFYDLENLYNKIKNKRICHRNNNALKFLLDTLPLAGTPASVEMMAAILDRNEISDLEQQVWLTSLSFIREPTEELIPSLVKLMRSKSGEQALLPVSALMNAVCKKGDCDQNRHFSKLEYVISSRIDLYCKENVPKILLTLRAIGNIGYGSVLKQRLKQCVTSRFSALEVKIAAFDAYRRFPCYKNADPTLWQVYESDKHDSELRIMSFLSLIRCPTKSTVGRIISQLGIETDDNVGSFVSSHLQSIIKSSDPLKRDTALMLKRHFYIRKYRNVGMQSSRTFEHSILLNKVNLGYVADSNLIFSGSSMVPRQLSFNLTVQLFGNSVNLFEIGTRMNSLEQFVEKYFGLKGYFSEPKSSSEEVKGFVYARLFGNELLFKQIKGSGDVEGVKSLFKLHKLLDTLSQLLKYKLSHSMQLMDESLIIPTVIGLPVSITVNSTFIVNADIEGSINLAGISSRSKPISVSSKVAAGTGVEVTGSMMVDATLYKQGVRMRNTLHSNINFKPNLFIKGEQILSFEMEAPPEKQELFDARSQFFVIHDSLEKEQQMISRTKDFNQCTGNKFATITGIEFCAGISYPDSSALPRAPFFPLTGPARIRIILNKKDKHRSYNLFAKWFWDSKMLDAQFRVNTPGSEVDRHISTNITIGFQKHPNIDIVLMSPWKKFSLNGKATMNDDIGSLIGSATIDENEYQLTSKLQMSRKGKQRKYLPFIEVKENKKTYTLLTGRVVHNIKKDITARFEIMDFNQNLYATNGLFFYSPKQKRLTLTTGEKGKRPYRFNAQLPFKFSGKGNENLNIYPELLIKTPKQTLVDLRSKGKYMANPMVVSGRVSLDVAGVQKTLELKGGISKKGVKYPVSVKLNMPGIQGYIIGDVKFFKSIYKSRMTVNYSTGRMKDRVRWNGIIRSMRYKHIVQSTLNFFNNPDYNTDMNLDFTHKGSMPHAVGIVTYYGKKRKNINKMVKVDASFKVDDNLLKLSKGQMTADLKVKVPEKKLDMKVNLNHQHSIRKVNSDITFDLKPFSKKPIKANISIEDKGSTMYNIHGYGNLETSDDSYRIDSNVIQHDKYQSLQQISFSRNNEKKHEMSAFLKRGETFHYAIDLMSKQHEKPLSLVLSGNAKNLSDFLIKLALVEAKKETYYVQGMTKMNSSKSGRWSIIAAHPERKVRFLASYDRMNDKTDVYGIFNWDDSSTRKRKPQVKVNGSVTYSDKFKAIALISDLKIETPFKNVETMKSKITFEKNDQIEASFVLGKSLVRNTLIGVKGTYQDLNHFILDANISSPWKQADKYNVEHSHMLDDEAIVLKTIFTKNRAKIGYDIDLKINNKLVSSDVLLLLSPAYEHDVTIKTKVQFENYPTAVFNKIKWAPLSSIDINGSLRAEAVDDFKVNLNLSSASSVMPSVNIGASNTRQGSLTVSHLNVDCDLKQVIYIDMSCEVIQPNIDIKIKSKGKIIRMLAKVYDRIDKSNVKYILPILPTKLYKHEGEILQEIVMQLEIEDKYKFQVDGSLTRGYGRQTAVESFKLSKIGTTLNDIAIDLILTGNKDEMEVNIIFKTVDNINLKALATFGSRERLGFQFDHAGSFQGLKLNGGLYFFMTMKPILYIDFVMTGIEHIELTAEYLVGYKKTKQFTYTHTGKDNRISGSADIKTDDHTNAHFEFIAQTRPIKLLSIEVSIPFNLSKISLSANYDDTSMNGLFMINEKALFTFTGSHYKLENLKITLKTIFKELQSITFENDGPLRDRRVRITVELDKRMKIIGHFLIKYVNHLQMKIECSFSSNKFKPIDGTAVGFGIKDDPRKHLYLKFVLDDDNQITYSLNGEDANSEVKLDIRCKDLIDQLLITAMENNELTASSAYLIHGSEKVFDVEVIIEHKIERKTIVTVRKPRPMEYTVSQGYDKNELELFWDKSDPKAKATIQSFKLDNSYSGKTDKSSKVLIICPSRTLTIEHAFTVSSDQYTSFGKFSWSHKSNSQVSYQLELTDLSNQIENHYRGVLKLKMPSRKLGVEGYVRDGSKSREVQSTFYWDLDRYPSNKVGLKGVLTQTPNKRAEITLIFPKEAHIDTSLVWDDGTTILEGQTNIHFSSNDSKTLTLSTKIENIVHSSYSGYLYSSTNRNIFKYN